MKQDETQVRKTKHTRSQIAGRWLLFWMLFIGLGAVAGASGMLLDPSGKAMGMDAMLPFFRCCHWQSTYIRTLCFRASRC